MSSVFCFLSPLRSSCLDALSESLSLLSSLAGAVRGVVVVLLVEAGVEREAVLADDCVETRFVAVVVVLVVLSGRLSLSLPPITFL